MDWEQGVGHIQENDTQAESCHEVLREINLSLDLILAWKRKISVPSTRRRRKPV
ncbi:MAG: hypothetical protein ACE5GK_10490 [Nitrospiria bacterium]